MAGARFFLVSMLTAALLATAGCVGHTGTPRSGPSSSPALDVIDDPATLKPLKLSDEPLWSHHDIPRMKVVEYFAIQDDAALVFGGDGVQAMDRLAIVDAATGRTRWAIGGSAPLGLRGGDGASFWHANHSIAPRIVGKGDDWSVIVEYYKQAGGDRFGLAALSGKDGRVRWKTPPIDLARADTTELRVVDVDNEIALVERTSDGTTSTIAIDVSNGRTLWDVPNVFPRGVSDGVVVAEIPKQSDWTNPVDGIQERTVVALDAKTGKRLWGLSDRYPRSVVGLVAGSAIVVRIPGRVKGSTRTLVVGTRSGDMLAELEPTAGDRCHSDRTTLIACLTYRTPQRLATYHLRDHTAGISAHETPDQFVREVWSGRIFMSATWAASTCKSYDRSGNPIDKKLPGTPALISDRYAAFYTEQADLHDPGLVVHRRLG